MKITCLIYSIFLVLSVSCSKSNSPPKHIIYIRETPIEVELANTPQKREVGLMYRKSLDADKGMLFVYDKVQIVYFWMKNTSIPLSIAYINSSGLITEINDLEPFSLKVDRSSNPVLYALEVNRGFFKRNGIKVGDSVRFP